MKHIPAIIILLLVSISCVSAAPALRNMDLLGGWGDFEFSADTSWQQATSTGWPCGVKLSTPDDSIAPGWKRLTGYDVVPEKNTIYRIEQGKGKNGTNCQYFALKDIKTGPKWTVLMPEGFKIDDSNPRSLHHGDTVNFVVDYIRMSGFQGVDVTYRLKLRFATGPGVNDYISTDLAPSQTPFSSSVSSVVPAGTKGLYLYVEITANHDLGANKPGIYVDGAHLYTKRAGKQDYEKEMIPVSHNRAIRTMMMFYNTTHDPYEIASKYDAVMLQQEAQYAWALKLRYYNPDIKLYLYESGGNINDWGEDSFYSNSPISLTYAMKNHKEWLYPDPNNNPPYHHSSTYLRNYYVHLENPEYQKLWLERTSDKVNRYRFDGVWIDDLGAMADGGTITIPAHTQSFLHGVVPSLNTKGIDVIQNACTINLRTGPKFTEQGLIYFDPKWKPNGSFPASAGYKPNSILNTSNALYQEWAFFVHWKTDGIDRNHYNINYWLDCLKDMDKVAEWNTLGYHKEVYVQVHGADNPDDPAEGTDGWAHFGLCSYLLASNAYTTFAVNLVSGYSPVDIDCSVTSRLGDPVGSRQSVSSDNTLQIRRFKNGLVIVNGHPAETRTHELSSPFYDESTGKIISRITLKPHTGRILFDKSLFPQSSF